MSVEEKNALEQQQKAVELLSQGRVDDGLPLYDKASEFFEAASGRYLDAGNQKDSLRCLGLSSLSKAEKIVAQAAAEEKEKRYEETANLFQSAGEELRKAAKQFSDAGFPLEEKHALAYLAFCKGKFYESQGLRHMANYDLEKALKYSENAADAYGSAFRDFNTVALQSLLSGRPEEAELSTLKLRLDESKRSVEHLQEDLSRAMRESEHAKKEVEQLRVAKEMMERTAREEAQLAKAEPKHKLAGKKYVMGMVGVTSAYAVIYALFRDTLLAPVDMRLGILILALAVIALYIGYDTTK